MAELNTSDNGKKRGRSKKALRVDLTAMVDLAFLLITFFILTTTLKEPKIMDVAMPADAHPSGVAASQTLSVVLGKDDKAAWYMGEIEEVTGYWANLNHPYIEVDDTAIPAVRFKSGAPSLKRSARR